MSTFHDVTLELLGEPLPARRHTAALRQWSEAQGLQLPPAYLEWAELDGAGWLEEYSNTDHDRMLTPRRLPLDDGTEGLVFFEECQGNFSLVVALDGSDDPPVTFRWYDGATVRFADHFSAAITARIFDWQHLVQDGEIVYSGVLRLREPALERLRTRYPEWVATAYVVDQGAIHRQHRFRTSGDVRITTDSQRMTLTGPDIESIREVEVFLRRAWSDLILPTTFGAPLFALIRLQQRLARGWLVDLVTDFPDGAVDEAMLAILAERMPQEHPYQWTTFPEAAGKPTEWTFTTDLGFAVQVMRPTSGDRRWQLAGLRLD